MAGGRSQVPCKAEPRAIFSPGFQAPGEKIVGRFAEADGCKPVAIASRGKTACARFNPVGGPVRPLPYDASRYQAAIRARSSGSMKVTLAGGIASVMPACR